MDAEAVPWKICAFNEEAVTHVQSLLARHLLSRRWDIGRYDYSGLCLADLRAPTPSAAAELAVSDYRQLMNQMQDYKRRISQRMQEQIMYMRQKSDGYKNTLTYLSPQNQILMKRQQLLDIENRLENLMGQQLTSAASYIGNIYRANEGIIAIRKTESRGFSYVEDERKQGIHSVHQVTCDRN